MGVQTKHKQTNVFATHKQLEFHVDHKGGGTNVFKKFEDACANAVAQCFLHGGPVNLDIIAFSKGAAKAWAGDIGVEQYNEDPEASVFERIIIKADSAGRVA